MTPDEVRDSKPARPRGKRRRRSRREFIQVIAAGAAAAIVTAPALAATGAKAPAAKDTTKSAASRPPVTATGPTPAVQMGVKHTAQPEEIDKLKKALDDQLKVIRSFPLAAGTPMGFTFRAQRVRRKNG